MKTNDFDCLAVVAAFVVLTQSQCSSGADAIPSPDAAVAFSNQHWVRVSSQPPTYFPRGVPANAPTDHSSGEWVYTDDSMESRYFIPFHGLRGMNRQDLISQALSARSERKLATIAAEDEEILLGNIRNMALFGPPALVAGLAGGVVGGDISKVDIHELQKEWNTARKPHE